MEPTKFEEGIKERLNKRKIQPNEELWQRLRNELDTEKVIAKKKKPMFIYWMGVAAAILLLVSLFGLFSEDEKSIPPLKEVVKSTDQAEEQIKTPIQQVELDSETPTNVALNQEEIKSKSSRSLEKDIVKQTNLAKIAPPIEQQVVIADVYDSNQDITAKINDVLAKVQELEKNSTPLTDAEVDSLLRKAQIEILNQKYKRLPQSIDAMALLDEVEFEIDSSIKNKLFEALKKGFREVRTAVAQRNQ